MASGTTPGQCRCRGASVRTVAFYEPSFSGKHLDTWQLRGGYKYPSLLEAVREKVQPILVMDQLPPEDDPVRQNLEREFRVVFLQTQRATKAAGRDSHAIGRNVADTLRGMGVEILSNLNGRKLYWCYATAVAAAELGAEYVYRIGGDDILTESVVAERQQRRFFAAPEYWDAIAAERLALARARTVIVMSPWEKRRVARLCEDPSRIQVCWRGVDLERFMPRDYPQVARKFLFVGRNSHEKGFDVIEQAAAMLANTHPDIQFLVAGPFEPGTVGNVTYLGYVATEQLPQTYASADAFILCSRTEGMPQAVMEAMAAGRACVLSRHLFETMLGHDDQVLLTDVDARALRDQVVRLHEETGLAERLARGARRFAEDHFGKEANLAHYERALLGTTG